MPNANTISRFVGAGSPAQGANVIPSITLVTTTEQLFAAQVGGTAIIFPQPVGQVLGATAAPSFGSGFDGFPIRVRAAFKTTTAGTSTIIIAIYANQVGTTITSGNLVATITSQSLVTASTSGWLEATLIWDSIGKTLSGGQQGAFGTTVVTGNAALTNTAISIPALSNLNFSITGKNGSSVVGNIVAITEFCVDAL
jgi:hypothetical protein